MSDLLEILTELLAYSGDDAAKDGYFLLLDNSDNPIYSIPIRVEGLSGSDLENFINQIKNLLENDEPLVNIPDDIIKKASDLKKVYDKVSCKKVKDELIEYIDNYEAMPMH